MIMVDLRHKILKTAKNQHEHNWGEEVLGACDPPCPLCKPFLSKQPTIFRWQKLLSTLCLTQCDPPPPFEKS